MHFPFLRALSHVFRVSVIKNGAGIRFLFTQEALRIPSFVKVRKTVKYKFQHGLEVEIRERMANALNSQQAIFSLQDVQDMIYLIQTDKDVDLCSKLMLRLHETGNNLNDSFKCGPVLMRACHHLRRHNVAYNLLINKEFEKLFDQLSSFVIVMDLLFEIGQYEKLRELFEILKEKQVHGFKYPANALILLFAACYKMNTPDSYKYVIDVLQDAINAKTIIPKRAAAFVAALALKQNDPKRAREILSCYRQGHFLICNLMLITLAKLNRTDEIIFLLEKMCKNNLEMERTPCKITQSDPPTQQMKLCPDVIPHLEEAINLTNNQEDISRFSKVIHTLFQTKDCVTTYTLEKAICFPVRSELKWKHTSSRIIRFR